MPDVVLYDASGVPVTKEARPPRERIAEIGRVQDPFGLRELREVTPATFAARMRRGARMADQNVLIQRILRDAHFAAILDIFTQDASSLDWEIDPFADDGKQGEHTQRAAWVAEQLYAIEEWDDLMVHLLYGELYPRSIAEIFWNDDYLPHDGFEFVDPARIDWNEQANALRLLTKDAQSNGVELTANGFTIYHSRLQPGSARDGGRWRQLCGLYLIKHFTLTDWLEFAEKFGKPIPIAKYSNEDDRDAVIAALKKLSTEFAGAFPAGVEIELKEAQRYGSVNVYETLARLADEYATKLFLGHSLVTDAKPGTGTLAGEGARQTNLKILRSVSRRLAAAIRTYIIRPMVAFKYGWDKAAELPHLKFKWQPATDDREKAKTYLLVNNVLGAAGEAIDPAHTREVFGIPKTVKLQKPEPKGPDAPPSGEGSENASIEAAEPDPPRLGSGDDIEAVTAELGRRVLAEMSGAVLERAATAPSIEAFADEIWRNFGDLEDSTERLATILNSATLAAEITARAEVVEEDDA